MTDEKLSSSLTILAGLAAGFIPTAVRADVFNMPAGQTSLQFVPVGHAGNPDDPATGFGGVPYEYNMGKFETTIGQYTQFLNAVAATDTYGLYHPYMASVIQTAGIARANSPGGFTYTPIGSPNRPIAWVSWADAARFANWLTNGQPTGPQGPGTTETGSYALNGAATVGTLHAVTRSPNARFVIPTGDEWYKAAYYDPTRGGSNYWLYPMRTDGPVYSAMPPGSGAPDSARTGNFFQDDGLANGFDNGYALTAGTSFSEPQTYLSEAGNYAAAASHYGTFDQGGNVFEWNDAILLASVRDFRGGSAWGPDDDLLSSEQGHDYSTAEYGILGFRISEVPEPATIGLLAFGGVMLRRRRPLPF